MVNVLRLRPLAGTISYFYVPICDQADEIFGGYNIFREAKARWFWSRNINSNLRPKLLGRLYPYILKDENLTTFKANALIQAKTFEVSLIMPLYVEIYNKVVNDIKNKN